MRSSLAFFQPFPDGRFLRCQPVTASFSLWFSFSRQLSLVTPTGVHYYDGIWTYPVKVKFVLTGILTLLLVIGIYL